MKPGFKTQLWLWRAGLAAALIYSVSQLGTLRSQKSRPGVPSLVAPGHIAPEWAPGTNLSLYFFLSSSPSGDVFAKTRLAPEVEERRKKKAEMRKNGYIGHGRYRKPLLPTDPDYEEQMGYIRKKQEFEEKRAAKKAAKAAEEAAAAEAAGEQPTDWTGTPTVDVDADPHPHAAGHHGHGMGRPQGGVMSFLQEPKKPAADLPSFAWHNIIYGDFDDMRETDLKLEVPFSVQRNSPLWAEIYITVNGSHPDPVHPDYVKENVHHTRVILTEYFPRTEAERAESVERADLMRMRIPRDFDRNELHHSHYNPELVINLVSDSFSLAYDQLDPLARTHVDVVPNKWGRGKQRYYWPIVYPHKFWQMRSYMRPLDVTTRVIPLHVKFYPTSLLKFETYVSLSDKFEKATETMPGPVASELLELKRLLVETPGWFVFVTALLGALSFARRVVGIQVYGHDNAAHPSRNQIIVDVLSRALMVLYILDNSASWTIALWEITRLAGTAKQLLSKDIWRQSPDGNGKKESIHLDRASAIFAGIASLVPSFLFNGERGWYSFTLRLLVSYAYVHHFVEMISPAIINYKRQPEATTQLSPISLALNTSGVIFNTCIAFIFITPPVYRLASVNSAIAFLAFLSQQSWTKSKFKWRLGGQSNISEQSVKT